MRLLGFLRRHRNGHVQPQSTATAVQPAARGWTSMDQAAAGLGLSGGAMGPASSYGSRGRCPDGATSSLGRLWAQGGCAELNRRSRRFAANRS
jgi:hypothetical protein